MKKGLVQNSGGAGTIVSNIPTLADVFGPKMTRPSCKRVAPENPEAAGTFENVKAPGSNIPTFADDEGTKTTFPYGSKHPPEKEAPVWTFEYVPRVGLYTPTFADAGTMMTFPFGAKTPPLNFVPVPPTAYEFETVGPNGFSWTTFEFVPGTHTTFPFGKRTALEKVPSFPIFPPILERVLVVGLNVPIFD